jgi:rod shape-determining protein MreD
VAEVKRAILSVVVLAAALLIQLTLVNRLPLPGGGAPDLVLLAVVALGLCSGPAAGAVTGFGAGLALDIAPPGSYLIGEYALVFCLVGYFCGRLRGAVSRSALLTIAVAMAAAAVGEAMSAALGLAVSDPQVTWPVVREVLPSAIVYDAVLAPFVLYVVVRAVHLVDALGRPAGASQAADGSARLARGQASGALPRSALNGSAAAGATALGGAGLLGGAGWLSGPDGSRGPRMSRGSARSGTAPRTPRLRPAAARHGDGWVGDAPRTGRTTPPRLAPTRTPRLRPGSGSAGSAVARPARPLPRPPVNLRLATASRRRDGNVGRALGAGAAGAVLSRPKSGPPGSAFRGRRPGIDRPAALARPGAPRSGALRRGPKFRPDPHLRGGSAGPDLRLGGSRPRVRPSRRVSLRLGNARRHDGVLGGSVLAGRARFGTGAGLAARPARLRLGSRKRGGGPGLAARPVSLRLGSGRRGGGPRAAARPARLRLSSGKRGGGPGVTARPVKLRLGSGRRSGALGGLSGRRGPWARPRLGTPRRAAPRFRSGVTGGGRPALGGGNRLRTGRRVRFTGSSFLTTWTGGLLGGRSAAVGRLGRRTGGLR